jgi:hypothetical protein
MILKKFEPTKMVRSRNIPFKKIQSIKTKKKKKYVIMVGRDPTERSVRAGCAASLEAPTRSPYSGCLF